ncbi:MAG: tetratricopeptide repeat protein [Bdellovibrionaceae bacterium]|nr:tetratricopeptide repeat protein [Pseudobdellovibrionaceae bacterium]MBX3033661.1 tetratricopeptide repeat protein [Pseudobdellovibrionaceae bacterium]
MKRPIRFLLLLGAWTGLVACSSPLERDLKDGFSQVEQEHYRIALSTFERVLKRAPESDEAIAASKEAARVSVFELKDFKKAAFFNRHLVLHAKDPKIRENAQKQLAAIYFDNLNDYEKAVQEYSKLLAMPLPTAEWAKFKIALARSYFYMGQFKQAESEVDDLLKEKIEAVTKFSALNLKGNILVAQKQFSTAAEIYKQLMRDFPERSRQENVALQLAVCYEENQDFRSAIQVLHDLKPGGSMSADYLELRIKRLQERMRNQPGAKGFGRK